MCISLCVEYVTVFLPYQLWVSNFIIMLIVCISRCVEIFDRRKHFQFQVFTRIHQILYFSLSITYHGRRKPSWEYNFYSRFKVFYDDDDVNRLSERVRDLNLKGNIDIIVDIYQRKMIILIHQIMRFSIILSESKRKINIIWLNSKKTIELV